MGVGGLINAYVQPHQMLLNGQIIDMKVYRELKVEFEYAQMNAVMGSVKEFKLLIDNQHFDLSVPSRSKYGKERKKRLSKDSERSDGCKISDVQ